MTGLLVLAAFLPGCAQLANLVPKAEIDSHELTELSGIAPAAPGQYWGVNDSGHPPELFHFDETGKILEKVAIEARNIDWEAMTRDASGDIYVADAGDNASRRGAYTIYRLAAGGLPKVAGAITFRYDDGLSRNCEALFAFQGRLYLISKEELGRKAVVFRIDLPVPANGAARQGAAGDAGSRHGTTGDSGARAGDEGSRDGAAHQAADVAGRSADQRRASRVAELPIASPVTDVAYSAERQELAVLTYLGATLFHFQREEDFAAAPTGQVPGFFGQCEALTYTSDGELLITNEPGALWKVSLPPPPQASHKSESP